MDLNPVSYRWSLRACRLGQSGSPRSEKRTDSLVKVKNSRTAPVVASQLSGYQRATRVGKTLGSIPGGATLCFFR